MSVVPLFVFLSFTSLFFPLSSGYVIDVVHEGTDPIRVLGNFTCRLKVDVGDNVLVVDIELYNRFHGSSNILSNKIDLLRDSGPFIHTVPNITSGHGFTVRLIESSTLIILDNSPEFEILPEATATISSDFRLPSTLSPYPDPSVTNISPPVIKDSSTKTTMMIVGVVLGLFVVILIASIIILKRCQTRRPCYFHSSKNMRSTSNPSITLPPVTFPAHTSPSRISDLESSVHTTPNSLFMDPPPPSPPLRLERQYHNPSHTCSLPSLDFETAEQITALKEKIRELERKNHRLNLSQPFLEPPPEYEAPTDSNFPHMQSSKTRCFCSSCGT